jgi:hypothetical protein
MVRLYLIPTSISIMFSMIYAVFLFFIFLKGARSHN